MKIKVTFEKEFESDSFYCKDCENLTFNEFKKDISDLLWEWPDELIPNLKFEEILGIPS